MPTTPDPCLCYKIFFNEGTGYGINVEPQHLFYEKLMADREVDVNVEAGISNEEGILTLYGREGSQAASFANKDGLNTGAKPKEVPVYTLANICITYLVKGEDIHFMKIDVEGWETQCIRGMDFGYVKPLVLCIESSNPGDVDINQMKWEPIVLNAGYEFAMQNRVNRYYISADHIDLKDRFLQPEELKSIYNVTRYTDNRKYEKYENMSRRIKSLAILRPVRYAYNYIKNRRS